jgi:hypothetical protein
MENLFYDRRVSRVFDLKVQYLAGAGVGVAHYSVVQFGTSTM